jgi:hypothetical protein
MKTHYCLVDKTTISYEGECNWCGEKEMSDYQRPHNTVLIPCDKLAEMQAYIKELEDQVKELKNPIMQAISQAFDAPRELSDKEIAGIYKEVFNWDVKESDRNWVGLARAILKKASEK